VHALIVENPQTFLVHWPDEAATQAFAQNLAQRPALRQALIELHGELGAGKTSFVRYLLRALGVQGRIKSPSYAIVEPYQVLTCDGQLAVWHFDLYRFGDPSEFEDAGFRDILASKGLKLIEWPQKAQAALPTADLALQIESAENNARQVKVTAYTARGRELLT